MPNTFFLDYEGGNDANDGLSFANRWKTITTGATAARIAPGDTIRIMAASSVTSIGNATWTDKSDTITIPSALTANVSLCNSAWTASTNVTCTTSTTRKEGSASASAAIASGFTTGLVAYDASAISDYSGYQQLTFWIKTSIDVAGSTFKLSLCSDGAGATPVDDFTITDALKANQWTCFCINKGSALGASIASVALYALLDPGTVTVLLDDILTAKAASSADALSLCSLLTKNTAGETCWGIRSINGTTIKLDSGPNSTFTTTPEGYSGTTETITTYKREPIRTTPAASVSTAVQEIQDSGTSGNQITFSGGWNRTDMSTQTDETWFDGGNGNGYGLYCVSKNFITISKLGFTRYYQGMETSSSSSLILDSPGMNNCQNVGFNGTFTSLAVRPTFSSMYTVANEVDGADIAINSSMLSLGNWTSSSNNFVGIAISSTGNKIIHSGTIKCKNNTNAGFKTSTGGDFDTIVVGDNGGNGLYFQSCTKPTTVNSLTTTSNSGRGVFMDSPILLEVKSYTSSGNGVASVTLSGVNGPLNAVFNNASVGEATKVTGFTSYANQRVTFAKIGGDVDANETYFDGGNIKSVVTNRHTGTGKAWQINVTDSTIRSSYDYPITLSLGIFAVNSSALVTLPAWIMRSSSTDISARIRIPGGWLSGIPTDVTTSATGATNTYQQETVSATPSQAGVVELLLDVFSATSDVQSTYVDDLDPSQA